MRADWGMIVPGTPAGPPAPFHHSVTWPAAQDDLAPVHDGVAQVLARVAVHVAAVGEPQDGVELPALRRGRGRRCIAIARA